VIVHVSFRGFLVFGIGSAQGVPLLRPDWRVGRITSLLGGEREGQTGGLVICDW
jgi:hypothetical protein